MMERSTRVPAAAPRPDGRRRQATKRSLYMRSTLWGGLTFALIGFLAWFIVWANEAGGMLP
jgi:hypothetical protein